MSSGVLVKGDEEINEGKLAEGANRGEAGYSMQED
jgi:hypothetical protein